MNRKSIEKLIVKGLILVGVLAIFPMGANAEWKKDNNGWWYTEGSSWSSGWKFIDNNWYYFDSNGYMKTGWVKDKNNWYYLYDNGVMAKNTSVGGYELNADGAWVQMKENNSSNNTVNSTDVKNNNTTENIDQAVSKAIKSRGTNYLRGEVATEGHIVLDVEEKDDMVKAYTIVSFGYFGFENGIFTEISGSGAIPTVMTFSKDSNSGYSLIEYKEPED
jgi:bla regulator protein BlaR1